MQDLRRQYGMVVKNHISYWKFVAGRLSLISVDFAIECSIDAALRPYWESRAAV